MPIWLLTLEPYHDNSTVLGVYTDFEPAMRAFFDAYVHYQDSVDLAAWVDGTLRTSLSINKEHALVPAELLGKPIDVVDGKAILVDPFTYDWTGDKR